MSEWRNIGPHRYSMVDGLLRVETMGEFSPEQTHAFTDLMMSWDRQHDECGALLNVRGGIGVPAASRRVMAQRAAEGSLPLPMAVVGASLPARAVITLLMNAIRMILKTEIPLAFFKDENEAEVWVKAKIQERSARLRALRGISAR